MGWSGLPERIERKIIPEPNSGCWLWLAGLDGHGYGLCRFEGRTRPAHRAVYICLVGPVGSALLIDHQCENPLCVNPEHLRPATSQQNTLRSKRTIASQFLARDCCAQGHPFTAENTGVEPRSRARICKTCQRSSAKKWQSANKDRFVEYSIRWQKKNLERVKEARRLYVENNREKLAAYARAYRKRKKTENAS